jgi:hypothetical protein
MAGHRYPAELRERAVHWVRAQHAVVLLAGILVFFRIAFGIWVGGLAALVQAFFAFFWLFTPYWPGALVIIALDMLAIYALATSSGDREYA